MRYNITSQQFDFFQKQGWIVFEELFSKEEASAIRSLLEDAQTNHRRDLERENPPLYKALKLSRLGQAAAQLFHKKRIKLAFTEFSPAFPQTISLEEISSVSELFGGCLIQLIDHPLPEYPHLPQQIGDVGFYAKHFPIDFSLLKTPCLLVAFASEKALYIFQENDPSTHFLKKLGYGFGDHLTNETHPIIAS